MTHFIEFNLLIVVIALNRPPIHYTLPKHSEFYLFFNECKLIKVDSKIINYKGGSRHKKQYYDERFLFFIRQFSK